MKTPQDVNLKTIAPTKVMHTAIPRYKDHAFNGLSEESGKKMERFIIKKPLRPVPSQGIVEQDR